jgi:hypothetical protein
MKWSLSWHETHQKNNSTQYTSCMDEYMKASMLEVNMAMTESPIFSKGAFDYRMDGVCGGGA